MSYETKPIEPTGTRTFQALVKRATGPCAFETLIEPTYPDNPRARLLYHARVSASWSVREVAKAIGMKPSDLSAVEHGRAEFVDVEDWERVMEFIEHTNDREEATP